jgi:hypothetical protein
VGTRLRAMACCRQGDEMIENRVAELEKEIRRLNIKLEMLIDHLNTQGQFGPPYSRDDYDRKVKQALEQANLLP